MKSICLSVILFGFATISGAQTRQSAEPPPFAFFEHFGEEQGVPGSVGHIQQDKQGYLWCVCEKGLLRFDGVQFRLFAPDPDDPNALPIKSIGDMLVASDGLIWFATRTGVMRFDPVSERFSVVPHSTDKAFISLLEDRNHRIWAGPNNAPLRFFDPQLDSLVELKTARCWDGYTGLTVPGGTTDVPAHLAESADGTFWGILDGATEDRVGYVRAAHIDPLRCTVEQFPLNPFLKKVKPSATEINGSLAFKLDEKNECLWMGAYGPGLFRFSLKTHEWRMYDLSPEGNSDPLHSFVYDIQHKNDSTLWLATQKGLKVFSIPQGRWTGFEAQPPRTWNAQPAIHQSVFRDRSGTTWFGHEKGLSRLDPYRQQFPLRSPFPPTFQAQAIAEYAPTEERLFAAWDDDGFFRVFAQHLRTKKIRQARQRLPFRPNDVACVHQLFVAPDGRIWALLNRGIGWIDPATLRLNLLDLPIANHTACRTPGLWARQMAADPEGNLWMATFGSGLIRYSPTTGQFWRPPVLPAMGNVTREYNDFAFSIFCDTAGRIFLGEAGTGVELWDRKHQTRRRFAPEAGKSHSFGGQVTDCIAQERSGTMWFGTEYGLCRYLPGAAQDTSFERIREVTDVVYKIVVDAQGRLWLATPKGLVCYDPKRKTQWKFGEKEGMLVPIDRNTPLFIGSDGEIWLGDDLHFNPAGIQLYPPAAVPRIVGFKIYDRVVPLPPPTEQGGQQVFPEMRLGPDQEVFSVEIGAFGFTAPEQTRLLYRLNEDDAWQEAGTQRTFTFNRLPGGRYRFELKAIAPDGTDSGRSVVLPLRVVPVFYRALWFWLLCLAAVGGGSYAFFRYREMQRLRQEHLRLRIARDLHDEVGSTLSSISILSASALRGVEKDIDTARLGNIGDKARAALESMSDIVWAVNPKNDPMPQIIRRMAVFASETFDSADIATQFSIAEDVETLSLPPEKRKDFYLIFKEAVTNCAKHSRARRAHIRLKKEGAYLVFELTDDGVGLSAGGSDTLGGNGLKNMAARAAGVGGEFSVRNGAEAGTVVSLKIPI